MKYNEPCYLNRNVNKTVPQCFFSDQAPSTLSVFHKYIKWLATRICANTTGLGRDPIAQHNENVLARP